MTPEDPPSPENRGAPWRPLIWLAFPFLGGWLALSALFYQQGHDTLLADAEDRLEATLLFHRALHHYVEDIQRPEIYRLKAEGHLYRDYFSRKVLSFTYIARRIEEFVEEERDRVHKPKVFFKLAARNPRNPINRADPSEADLLRRMNAGEIQEYRGIVERNGGRYLYFALPVQPNKQSCMSCHGDPKDAPAELLAQYGTKAGFHEVPGEIHAFIALWTPLDGLLGGLYRETLAFSAGTFVVLGLVYALIAHLIFRLHRERARVMAQNRALARLSTTDALTDLFNRREFNRRLRQEIHRARRYGTPLSLMILDLDHFKGINDRFGHPAGDEVLRRFAAFLREHSRDSDLAARWGGEEFAVLLPHTGLKDAGGLADSLRGRLSQAVVSDGTAFTVSIGVAALGEDDDEDTLIRRADRALYEAKRSGRNRVEIADPGAKRGAEMSRETDTNR